ncbi:MAG TPA: hypothetical protein VLF20_03205 [Patescibacteria group bacterium]|nr:hypothetical protein [Patescibacteria group bacterium]
MFATKIGFLGFVYIFATKFLDSGKRRHLFTLLGFIFFSASMAHTATLWYVFYGGFVLYVLTYVLLHRKTHKGMLRRGIGMLLLVLAINLYWILPNVYYSLHYGEGVITAKINRLFSEEAYLNNKAYGDIADFLLFKNFLFNWNVAEITQITQDNTLVTSSVVLLQSWKTHLGHLGILIIGYVFSFVALVGVAFALKKRSPFIISLFPITTIAMVFLLSNVPGFAQLFDFLRSVSDFFKEALRFPFTKLSLSLIFAFSVFFAYGHMIVLRKFTRKIKVILYGGIVSFLIILYSWPAFTGNYISSVIRVQIPQEYYALFDWSQKEQEGRMLELPMYSLYGWVIYDWGESSQKEIYQGAGFTWFGLKQSLLNREFDRWYPYNEQSYRELSYALYSNDTVLFEKLLQKYNITYLLVDQNIASSGIDHQSQTIFLSNLQTQLQQIPNIRLAKQFGPHITVYEYHPQQTQEQVFLLEKPKNIVPSYRWGYIDQAYLDYGDYVTDDTIGAEVFEKIVYPTRNILTNNERINTEILWVDALSYKIDVTNRVNGNLTIPDVLETEKDVFTDIYLRRDNNSIIVRLDYLLPLQEGGTSSQEFVLPQTTDELIIFTINSKVITATRQSLTDIPLFVGETTISTREVNTVTVYERQATKLPITIKQIRPYICSALRADQIFGGEITGTDGFSLYAKRAKVCEDVYIPVNFDQRLLANDGLILLDFTYQINPEIDGSFCLYDDEKKTCDNTVYLSSFIATERRKSIFVPFTRQTLEKLSLRFSFDSQEAEDIQTFAITDIQPVLYEKSGVATFLPQISNQSSVDSALVGKFPQETIDLTAGHMTKAAEDCGITKAEYLNKQIIDGVLNYISRNGNLCDIFSLPDFSQQIGYIVAVTSQNVQGLPIRICLRDDVTKKCLIEDELSRNNEFATDYFFLPPYHNTGEYHLVMTNISIGEITTENRIQKINIIPFPYSFFQGIQQKSANVSEEGQERIPTDFIEYAPFYYALSANQPKKNSVIVLAQAYEKNWKAYRAPSWVVENPVLRVFVPLFGRELEEHVLVNNWANGWVITDKEIDINNYAMIAIFFLPQWLEYIGFIFLLIPFIVFLKKKRQDKKIH